MSLPDAQHGLDWPERKRILLEFIAAEDQRQLEAEQRKLAEGLAKNLRQMLTPAQVVEVSAKL